MLCQTCLQSRPCRPRRGPPHCRCSQSCPHHPASEMCMLMIAESVQGVRWEKQARARALCCISSADLKQPAFAPVHVGCRTLCGPTRVLDQALALADASVCCLTVLPLPWVIWPVVVSVVLLPWPDALPSIVAAPSAPTVALAVTATFALSPLAVPLAFSVAVVNSLRLRPAEGRDCFRERDCFRVLGSWGKPGAGACCPPNPPALPLFVTLPLARCSALDVPLPFCTTHSC